MSQPKKLLALMQFSTLGKRYQPRKIKSNREELELVLSGRAILRERGNTVALSVGDLVWHKGGDLTISSGCASDDYECLILAFEVEKPTPPTGKVRSWKGAISPRQFAEDSLNKLGSLADEEAFADYLYASCLIHTESIQRNNNILDFSTERTFNLAYQYIAQNFKDPNLSVNHVAAAANVSVSQLHSVFKRRVGQTPHHKIMQLRMEHSQVLLQEKHLLKQVAAGCGFASENGFCKAFKKYFGQTPKYFRRQKDSFAIS